ncbi:helix-turn-helix domain-containing GNAT family N-acetyltransferase [Nonomuraea sp. NPDC050310]|uniref:bifunctional helix-turn-helix transcriptional regulator/GNAT family N-acetyltransferase n=1 Tax=Nonomuraea sp. NPDC050310 TaxID=3154935 RepID=UPI0033DBA49B
MDATLVDRVRRFNRTVTQRAGALEDAFLSLGRPLGQARLLWEIGPGGADLRELRARLELDSGYLSRLLRALEAEGLVTVDARAGDGRVRTARLTEAGLAARDELDRRSDDLAASILLPLDERQRERLVSAMAEVERLLTASTVRFEVLDPAHPDARRCLAAYYAEIGDRFEHGFELARARQVRDEDVTPPAGLLLVAMVHGEPVGCGALKLSGLPYAEIKRMWVSPAVRGLGLGRRFLAELEDRAAAAGAKAVRLDTNRSLTEAISLYHRTGYHEVPAFNDEPYAHHWFEKPLG